MKIIPHLIALTCIASLTACGDGTTDADLPVGIAPNKTDSPVSDKFLVQGQAQDHVSAHHGKHTAPLTADELDKQSREKVEQVLTALNELDHSKAASKPDAAEPAELVVDKAADKPKAEAEDKPDIEFEEERRSIPGLTYLLPKDWSVGPARQMRLLTLVPPKEHKGAEMAIAKWNGDVGGFEPNVARWARQVGIKQDAVQRKDYPQIDIDGAESAWIKLVNEEDDKAILALWIPRGENPDKPTETWTVKLTGTAKQINALVDTVQAWAGTIKFEDE